MIVTAALDAPLNFAVTVATPPLSEIDEDDKISETVGVPSSSVIVPVPMPVAILALFALLNVMITVSFDSLSASPVTDTSMFLLVCPAVKVNVPEVTAV